MYPISSLQNINCRTVPSKLIYLPTGSSSIILFNKLVQCDQLSYYPEPDYAINRLLVSVLRVTTKWYESHISSNLSVVSFVDSSKLIFDYASI